MMGDSYKALCSDFYINQKLTVKMDLPRSRETVLEFFERVRKQFPQMGQFRRYREELALESPQSEAPHRWLAVRSSTIRSGSVNPPTTEEGYSLHQHVLETAPYFLNVSPLDIDSVELLFGFDLAATGNHNQIVADAVLAGSAFRSALELQGATITECQPVLGVTFGARGEYEINVEIKTRGQQSHGREGEPGAEPISIYLILRRLGAVTDLKELPKIFAQLTATGEELVEKRVVPTLLTPIREVIAATGSG
jgi:hypothetical protein